MCHTQLGLRGVGMDVATIRLSARLITGKKVKRLRRQGIVPVHVYGTGQAPRELQVEAQLLRRILRRVGTNIPVNVGVDGEEGEEICFVREVQRHPVTEELLHVDFMRVDASRPIESAVPIVLEGISPAVRHLGGTMVQPIQALLVESLPLQVPHRITIDVSGLDDFEKSIHVSDVVVPPNVTIVMPPGDMICRVLPPRLAEEEAAPEVAPEAEAAVTEGEAEEAGEKGAASGERPRGG